MFIESLFTINPEVEKLSIISDDNFVTPIQYAGEEFVDLRKVYLITSSTNQDNIDSIKDMLHQFHLSRDEEISISSDVLAQCYLVLDNIYPSLIDNLNTDNVYSTPYGTMVFDWETDENNVFSLEISSTGVGYFIEKDGVDTKQVDNLSLKSSLKEMLLDLSKFLTS